MRESTRAFGRALCTAAAALLMNTPQAADNWPQRPITIVAAFPPGGGADSIARLLTPKLNELLKGSVVVDNKPGASGNIATEYVVHASPDGYTLLMNNNTLTINSALGLRQAFSIQRDLKPVAAVASTPIVIAVNSALPVHNLAELVAYAKKQPGKLNFSSCGNGTAQHFTGMRFVAKAGIDVAHVPYKGCAPAVIDGIGNVVPVLFNTVPNVDAHVQSGKLRYIAVGSEKRLAFRPDIPTIAETPGFEGFQAEVWFGLFAPARTPPDVLKKLEAATLAAMKDPAIQKGFTDRQISVRVLDSARFAEQVADDLVFWKKLADQFNVKLD